MHAPGGSHPLSRHLPATCASIFLIIGWFRIHVDSFRRMIWIMIWVMFRNYLATLNAFEPPQAMYVACWAFTRTPLLRVRMVRGLQPVYRSLPQSTSYFDHVWSILIFTYLHQGQQVTGILTPTQNVPRSRTIPSTLVFDLDMVHLTTLDRKIMGQMVRRRLRHAPCLVVVVAGLTCTSFQWLLESKSGITKCYTTDWIL